MGNPVTVDSDDLERILMLTGVHKTIEQLLHQHKGDPFIEKDGSKLADAHDRLASECRRATRGQIHPEYNNPVSLDAYNLLLELSGKISHIKNEMMRHPLYQELTVKGMIEYGSGYEIIYWSDTKTQQRLNPVERILVKITARAQKLLIDMATKDNSSIQ